MPTGRWCAWLILFGSAAWSGSSPVPTYQIDTVAGSADVGDGGPARTAEFGNIEGVACDRSGNLYLSDTDFHRVRKISAAGVVTTVAGAGIAGFGGDGGRATQAFLNMPYGLAVGPAGDIYIADLGNHRVRRITPDGIISTVAGNGTCGSSGDGGPAAGAALCGPRNVLLDRAGNLYISEFEGHRIRKVSSSGIISRIAGLGSPGPGGDGTPAVLAQLAYPAGLGMDQRGSLYVADSQNQRIRRITPDGWISTILDVSAGLLTPTGVAVDRNGTIYVADQSYSVRSYTGRAWITVAGTSVAGFAGDGGSATYAQLSSANDVAVDSDLNLYVADGVRVRRVDPEGVIQTVAGDGYVSAVGDGGRAALARLFQPSAVALDEAGNLYITDTGTQRVRKVTPADNIASLTGTGLTGLAGEGVPAFSSPVNEPTGVAIDDAGNLVFAETGNHRIRRVSGTGLVSTVAGTGTAGVTLQEPRGVCSGPDATLFVVDTSNHRVLRVDPDARATLVAGTGAPGDSGDQGPALDARLNGPAACAVDGDGNILVADTLNHRIRKVTPAGIIAAVAGTGYAGSSGDEGPALIARFSAPAGVAVDRAGNIFISDTGNHRIRQITPDGTIHTIAGGGAAGFAGDGGSASSALLSAPGGLTADASGNIYFADTNNNRVRRLTPQAVLPPPPLVQLSAVNAASLLEGPVAPGEILTIFGQSLGPAEGAVGIFDSGVLATEAGGTEVRFDGIAAPVLYAQDRQVNVQVPYTVAGADATQVEIRYQDHTAQMPLAVVEAAPALFPVAANQDGSPNSAAEPALRGTVVMVYGTGEGLTDGLNQAGRIAEIPYARLKLPVSLTVGGAFAEILYAGSAPGLVGVFQINVRMPGYVPPGAAPMVVTVGRASSPALQIWLR